MCQATQSRRCGARSAPSSGSPRVAALPLTPEEFVWLQAALGGVQCALIFLQERMMFDVMGKYTEEKARLRDERSVGERAPGERPQRRTSERASSVELSAASNGARVE